MVEAGDEGGQTRAWKLFILIPRMLLSHTGTSGANSRRVLQDRMEKFRAGSWLELIADSHATAGARGRRPSLAAAGEVTEEQLDEACQRVRLAEVSYARQALTSAPLAPGNAETLRLLRLAREQAATDQEASGLPQHLLDFQPERPLNLDRELFLKNVRSAKRGVSGGPSGMKAEHLQVLLDVEKASLSLASAAELFARARMPAEIVEALRFGRLTALAKPQPRGGVRGIVTGDLLRRLVARTLAQTHAEEMEDACRPHQYALSTRAGTDCVGLTIRALLEMDPDKVVLSLDGVGAYDHIRRGAMLGKLASLPGASAILPFVRLFYADASTYVWTDAEGVDHDICQTEGGEQGDPLMPVLYALGQADALAHAQSQLQEGDVIFSFLDDIYVITTRARAAEVYQTVAESIESQAGVRSNLGKLEAWSPSGGPAPPGLATISPTSWKGDLPERENGILVLGVPVGLPAFIATKAEARMTEERRLLESIPRMPDLQCAWALLLYSAVPRANHFLRLLPPSLAQSYARAHDMEIRLCLAALLQLQEAPLLPGGATARVASMPIRLGGLGLRSAERTSPGAYWAAWADVLPMVQQRHPEVSDRLVGDLGLGDLAMSPSLREATQAGRLLDRHGMQERPSWRDLQGGARPRAHRDSEDERLEPGEWTKGWQYMACIALETFNREQLLLPSLRPAHQAHVRSCSGPGAGHWLLALPTRPELTMQPEIFQTALRRRLRLHLQVGPARCPGRFCNRRLDPLGDHSASCALAGNLQRRAKPLERVWIRVLREAGGRVLPQPFLRDLDVGVQDDRRVDMIARGLPVYGGLPICGDASMVSAIHDDGTPWRRAAAENGVALQRARDMHEQTYPELVHSDRLRLIVLGCELGGRQPTEALLLIRQLAAAKAREAPELLRKSAQFAWQHRWLSLVSIAAQTTLAQSLSQPQSQHRDEFDGWAPDLSEALQGLREAPAVSRLPLRG
jgi:hypothetical protein